MPWGPAPLLSLLIPEDAGPNDGQIIIGSDLPDCMQGNYASAIFFRAPNTPTLGRWDLFIGVWDLVVGADSQVDIGFVNNSGGACGYVVVQRFAFNPTDGPEPVVQYNWGVVDSGGTIPVGTATFLSDVQNILAGSGSIVWDTTVDNAWTGFSWFLGLLQADGALSRNAATARWLVDRQQGECDATLTLTTAEQTISGLDMTLANTIDGAEWDISVSCDSIISVAGAGSADVRLYVDGALVGPRGFFGLASSTGRGTIAKRWSGVFSTSGNHTVEFRALKSNAAPTITIQNAHSNAQGFVYQ